MAGLLVRATARSPARLLRALPLPSVARATVTATASATRAFSGNVEYPRIEGSVADVTKQLNAIGARLSIPTAALYLTKQKLEFVVRGMQTPDELRDVQRALLLCDSKYVYPSEFTIGSFVSRAIAMGHADVALEFVRNAQHMRHYMQNQSFVRLATHYAELPDGHATVDEIARLVDAAGVTKTPKWFGFQVAQAKRQGDYARAEAIAKEAADAKQINAHVVLTLLEGLEGPALTEKLPLAHYLVAKGEVFANEKLAALLKSL